MKKTGRSIIAIILLVIAGCVAAFFLLQFLPIGRDTTNPPVAAEPNWDSPRTRELFMRACGDCHSNETVWPWYSKVAPVSWLVTRDIQEGRSVFNISEWGRGENESEEAAALYQEGEMPPGIFLIMHPEARLSSEERQELLNGLMATFGGEGGEGD